MTFLADAAIARLQAVANWPEFEDSRYTIVDEIGRGGMGAVYLARDERLGREVAIKVSNGVAGADLERRLYEEARIVAALEHPGIVPIHDCGRLADGRLFYVMTRVRGSTLSEHVRQVQSLSETELKTVTGGLGLSVKTEERLALQQQLTRRYAIANPYDYYGVTWIG